MKYKIIAFGIIGESPEKKIFENFNKRIKAKITIKELEYRNIKSIKPDEIKQKEANLIFSNIDENSYIISLDENGKQFSSIEFAQKLENIMLNGNSNINFVIGGANGLDKSVIEKSNLVISLGKMTLPHILARILLIEQLYRAQTILANHPYHRQ
jgi:23S rRNA (pseudouridine1915-N3)-methyltransferase